MEHFKMNQKDPGIKDCSIHTKQFFFFLNRLSGSRKERNVKHSQASSLSGSSTKTLPTGLANRSVCSWNGDFVKRVSLQKSGVRNP
jgi:hypothetical protein